MVFQGISICGLFSVRAPAFVFCQPKYQIVSTMVFTLCIIGSLLAERSYEGVSLGLLANVHNSGKQAIKDEGQEEKCRKKQVLVSAALVSVCLVLVIPVRCAVSPIMNDVTWKRRMKDDTSSNGARR